jgi:hypothetical protein
MEEKTESEEELGGFPNTCKKCGCEWADVVDLGAPYGDESNVYLFKYAKNAEL